MCTARTGGQGMMERGGREISCGAICLSSAGPRSAYLHQPMRVKGKKKAAPHLLSLTLRLFLSFFLLGGIYGIIYSLFFSLFLPPICTSTTRPTSLLSCLSTCQFVRQKKGPALKRESDFYLSLFKYSCYMISAALVWWWWL